MNYLYSILGMSAFFTIMLYLIDWETRKREARARAEWDARYNPVRKTRELRHQHLKK
jgi:hypothetical protein